MQVVEFVEKVKVEKAGKNVEKRVGCQNKCSESSKARLGAIGSIA